MPRPGRKRGRIQAGCSQRFTKRGRRVLVDVDDISEARYNRRQKVEPRGTGARRRPLFFWGPATAPRRCGHDRSARFRRPLAAAVHGLARRGRLAAPGDAPAVVVLDGSSPTVLAHRRPAPRSIARRLAADAIGRAGAASIAAIAWSDAGLSAGACRDRRSAAGALDARPHRRAQRAGRRDRRLARGVAVRARRRRAARRRSRVARPRRSSAASRAASIRRRIAARWRSAASTIAVLGSGADVMYPPEHAALAAAIERRGLIVSELDARDAAAAAVLSRSATGSSAGCRAPSSSSKRARGAGRSSPRAARSSRDATCWRCPGNVLSGRNRGGHALLRDGARIVETADDILEELGIGRAVALQRRRAPACQPRDRARATRCSASPGAGRSLRSRRDRRAIRPDIAASAAAAVRAGTARGGAARRRRAVRPG